MLHINRQNKTRKRHIGGGNRLIAAVTANNLPLVTQLLSQILGRSHVNSKGTGTKTPLIIAAENDFREIFTLLLRHGADPFIRDNSGKCVINYVSPDAADILLTHIETHGLMRQTLIALTELLTDAPVIFFQKFS
jgi:ankyrin repeat protein